MACRVRVLRGERVLVADAGASSLKLDVLDVLDGERRVEAEELGADRDDQLALAAGESDGGRVDGSPTDPARWGDAERG